MGGNWKCNNNLVGTKNIIESVLDQLAFDTNRVGKFYFMQRLSLLLSTCIYLLFNILKKIRMSMWLLKIALSMGLEPTLEKFLLNSSKI